MSQQIQITGGAKVRDLQDVIIGTSGVLSSLAFDVANGVPKLDSNGKILVSQLPNSVMEYKGTWDASTNTPTLANGTGNQGDVYLCNVAGTVNFGAGPIAFIVGDSAVYSGSIWQRSGGATGSVTSVGLSTNGGAITIGSSPVTTSGTISFNFNGTNLQYVNGAGNLTTFPTLITSIGLSMPSAFSVSNSPLTANGTIAVTGAGTTAQYIRGDGSLATFPTIATEAQRLITEVYNETGATLTKGTVVYINGGHGNLPTITKAIATGDATSAQTYGIVQTDITNNNNGYVVVIGSLTDLDTQAYANGTQLYLSSTTAGAWTSVKQYAPAHLVYVGIVTRSHPTQGVVEVRIQNGFEMDELHNVSAQSPANGGILQYVTSTGLWTAVAGTTTNIAEGTNLYFTDAKARLAISLTTTETSGASTYNNTTGVLNIPQYQAAGTYVTSVTGTSPIVSSGGTTPAISIPVATSSANGYLSSTDWLTFNGKIGGGGTTNYIPKFSGTFSIADSIIYDNSGNVLINTTDSSIGHRLAVYSATEAAQLRVMGLAPSVLFTESTTNTNSYSAYLGVVTSVNNFYTGSFIGDFVMSNNSNYGIAFAINNSQKLRIANTGAATFASSVTATSFVKTSGTSSQYLMADGSVSTLTNPVTGTGTTNYLPKFTGTSAIGNSLVYDNGTNVGINTASPSTYTNLTTLTINGTNGSVIDFKTGEVLYGELYSLANELRIDAVGASGTLKLLTNSVTRATINASGNLGLGVTPSAWSGVTALQVVAACLSSNTATSGMFLSANAFFDGAADRYINTKQATRYYQLEGNHVWQIAPSGTAGAAITFTQAMTLTAAGRLLLGTATESTYLLDVNGTGRFSGNVIFGGVSNNIYSYSTDTVNGQPGLVVANGTSTGTSTNINYFKTYNTSATTLFGQSVLNRLFIGTEGADNNGILLGTINNKPVIIGTNNTANLTIAAGGAATFSSSVTTGSDIFTVVNGGIFFNGSGNYGSGIYQLTGGNLLLQTGGVERMRINSDGVVQIGGSPYSGNNIKLFVVGQDSTSSNYGIYVQNLAGTPSFYTRNDGLTYLSGNVLIGNGATDVGSLIHAYTADNRDNMVYTNANASLTYAIFAAKTARAGGTSCYFYYGEANSVTTYRVYNNGNVQNTNNSYTGISDISIKENILDATPKLADLLKVRVVNYNLKAPYENHKQIGVIAQELEKIFPNMIDIDTNTKLKSVKYSIFVPMLIKAVQELKQEIEILKNK